MKAIFTIPGEPKGKGRPRFARVGNFVRAYTPADTASYENLVRLEFQSQCRGVFFEKGTPVDMRVMVYMTIPKSASKKQRQLMIERKVRPMKKPDSTNLLKSIEDGLNGAAYHDDSQIVDTQCRRFYGEQPRVIVTLQEAKLK